MEYWWDTVLQTIDLVNIMGNNASNLMMKGLIHFALRSFFFLKVVRQNRFSFDFFKKAVLFCFVFLLFPVSQLLLGQNFENLYF